MPHLSLALAFALCAPRGAQAAASQPVSRVRWLMGTPCEITAFGADTQDAVTAAFDEIARWDRVMSLYEEDSELSRLNREAGRAPFACSASLWEAIGAALGIARLSEGAFDPAVLPLLKGGSPAPGYGKLALDAAKRSVSFTAPGMGLDLGGIGKGLALDHAAGVLRERGVGSALINFGGQVFAVGAPPGKPGWAVSLESGRRLLLKDASASTSGNSEQPGHIVSPFTGLAVKGSETVTVVAPTGAQADGWSTALFVLGRVPAGFTHCAIRSKKPTPKTPACAAYKPSSQGGSS